MTEKGILAYFRSPAEAESVLPKLKALRVIDMSIDKIGQFSGDGVSESINPVSGNFPGLAYLDLGADGLDIDSSILAAANTDASGLSAPRASDGSIEDYGGINGLDTLLTVVVNDQSYDQALRVIRDAGGQV
ncbi:hypothetical protein [Paenibacillus radicis (ex Xue et al. 2023)]|uniref:Uncharacterized protein n=1 Tax=Paenibacillus radicis (ex Xue et al. 2023) TaxID=2972489 RepID=A0ABT1YE31_9BACL|nr:hypothetical protein [Paenibacillus radicis (ex Xue et al. 2023)]MCR8631447.1 hypothetical protein [Paenibacillus radicis (ex Xue et al. 2023)]